MASRGKPAARAWVEISGDDAKLRRVLRGIRARLNRFFASVKRAAGIAGKAIAAGIAAGLAASIALAVKFEDVLTRTKGVFQEMAGDAQDFARLLAGRVGKSLSETLQSVNEIGASFRAAGLSAATSFELASRTAAAAAVLADRLGVDQGSVENALMQAARGRATGLQRLGLGITPQELQELAESLNLDVQNSADQIRLYAAVLEQVESKIDTNTSSIGAALDAGENASQRLSRIYAQIRDQLTELGQKMLPVFSNMLAGVSVMLGQIEEVFSERGIFGVGRLFLDAAKPFTDVIIAAFKDLFWWVFNNMANLFDAFVHNLGIGVNNAIRAATGRGPDPNIKPMDFELWEFVDVNTWYAIYDLMEHLEEFGKNADAAALEMREKFEKALAEIQAGAENLRNQIDSDLGPGGGQSQAVREAAGTFSARAAFALETRFRNQEMRMQKNIEQNTKDSKEEIERQTRVLENIDTNTRRASMVGVAFA